MIRVLKQGATEAEKTEADRKVRQTVESDPGGYRRAR